VAFGQLSSFIPDIVKARVSAAHLFRMIEQPSYIDPLDGLGVKPVRPAHSCVCVCVNVTHTLTAAETDG
jgi:hypothetical protein